MHYTFSANLNWKKAKLCSDKSFDFHFSALPSRKTTRKDKLRNGIVSQKHLSQKCSQQKSDFP